MAWSDPGDFTSGQILTAAQMDSIREAMFFGQGTFATEAARDTAFNASGAMSPITLQEGMRAYITGSTVADATGATTAVPTGITTIYNGSAWVCTTPVGAYSNTSATTTSTTYVTTLTGDSTAISATLATGTTALLHFTAVSKHDTTSQRNFLSFSVSGATTLAASDANSVDINQAVGNYTQSMARTMIITGLTAGTNTFTLNYKCQAGTSTWISRNLVVQGIA